MWFAHEPYFLNFGFVHETKLLIKTPIVRFKLYKLSTFEKTIQLKSSEGSYDSKARLSSYRISVCCPWLDLKIHQPTHTQNKNLCMCFNVTQSLSQLLTKKNSSQNTILQIRMKSCNFWNENVVILEKR